MTTKRLRIFAGPNGSGKSTLKRKITGEFSIPFGYFVNADEIEREIRANGFFDFSPTGLRVLKAEFVRFAQKSSLTERAGLAGWLRGLHLRDNRLSISGAEVNSYHAALVADFVREKLLELRATFSVETVLSDARKLDFMARGGAAGYRVYLYFVATGSPEINLNRVKSRFESGGHDVPEEKIRSRYEKTLANLPRAIGLANRAYLFDNSTELELVAEVTDNLKAEFHNGDMPDWVKSALGQ